MKLNFDILTSWYNQPLHTLEEIKAKKKDLDGIDDISSCSKLRKLVLSENTLSNNNTSFSGLDHLTFLDLSHNEFSSLNGLENMTQLNVLNVSNNAITQLPEDLSHFGNLKALILNNNQLSKVPGLDVLTNLNTLVISHNSVTKIPNLMALPKLVKVSASHNKLKEVPNLSGQSASLKELRLNDNKIVTIPNTLRKCQALAIIDLGNNRISKWSDIASLGSLLNLHNLNLRGNPITKNKDYKDKILALVPSLRVLDGERFDLKFLERKQKQSSNLKLMEKKDRLKREKLEKQLEADYGLEAPARKPRHKHLLREEEGLAPKKSVKKNDSDNDSDKKPAKKNNSDNDNDKKPAKKKNNDEKKNDDEKVNKRKVVESADVTITKPTKKKKPDTFFDPSGVKSSISETTVDKKEPTTTVEPSTKQPIESAKADLTEPAQPQSKRKADRLLSQRERSGVLSVVDKSKKLKKKADGEDVLATLEQINKKQEESTGLGADAWD
ncbi:hypothetical protein BC941DRAFT_497280 [Chlamydoabsidia padenii]|nr:hypothetical protein BC941DRAFT_497280 [Chlamydoabsidia padenii]